MRIIVSDVGLCCCVSCYARDVNRALLISCVDRVMSDSMTRTDRQPLSLYQVRVIIDLALSPRDTSSLRIPDICAQSLAKLRMGHNLLPWQLAFFVVDNVVSFQSQRFYQLSMCLPVCLLSPPLSLPPSVCLFVGLSLPTLS